MKFRKSTQHEMQGVFVFVLLGLFAVMATLLVLLGAQMYRGTVDHSEANNAKRVLSSYVRSMVRAEDAADAIDIEKYGDVTVLGMRETIEGRPYVTWLYEHEGQLYEQFTGDNKEFDPAVGDAICAVKSFEPEIADGLLTIHMTDVSDEDCTVQVALRCK